VSLKPPPKPPFPPLHNHQGHGRPAAPHVQAALGAVQAKVAAASPAARPAAPHVQAAIGRVLQPKTALAPAQPKPASARIIAPPAPHIAKAIAAAQPKLQAPQLPTRPVGPAPVQPKLAAPARPAIQAAPAATVVQCGKQKKLEKARDKKFGGIRKMVRSSTGKLRHKRYPTAYGAFNKARKTGQQGPHTTAHIATSSALEVARLGGTSFSVLLNSAIVPRPRQVNRYVREGLRDEDRYKQEKSRVKKFVKQYQTLYTKAKKGDKIAIEKLIEKNPVATYGWDRGKVSSKEISGKGERRTTAIDDFESYQEGESISNLKTVDTTSGFSDSTEHRYDQLSRLTYGHDEFSEDDGSSESDSDIELD
jgi:hypothetical protein